jgi:hypothetical protein
MTGEIIMADWLKKVLDQVDREYNALPAWKRSDAQESQREGTKCSNDEDSPPNIRDPKAE